MLSLYLVACLLALEITILALLLAPYINQFTAPAVGLLLFKLRHYLRVLLAIITFLLYEAIVDMRRYQHKIIQEMYNPLSHMETLRFKFRSERNFYLFAFTFVLFIVILRLEVILNRYQATKQKVKRLEAQLKNEKKVETQTPSKTRQKELK